jgi:hypothetical protein
MRAVKVHTMRNQDIIVVAEHVSTIEPHPERRDGVTRVYMTNGNFFDVGSDPVETAHWLFVESHGVVKAAP